MSVVEGLWCHEAVECALELALVAARFVSVWLSKGRDELRTDLRSGGGWWLVVGCVTLYVA